MGYPIFKQTQTHMLHWFSVAFLALLLLFYGKKSLKIHDKTIQLGVARLETPHPGPARVAVVRAPRKMVSSARPPLHRIAEGRGGGRWWRF